MESATHFTRASTCAAINLAVMSVDTFQYPAIATLMTLAPFCLVSHDVEEFRFHVAMGKRTIDIVAAIQKVIFVARAR
jgi:hypothetical protein